MQLLLLASLIVFLNATVLSDGNVEIISLNKSQYCFVNQTTIRVSDNFTSELQDIYIYKAEILSVCLSGC